LLLFVHVILYAPSNIVPNPDTTPLVTVIATVVVYGLAAVAFWAWFGVAAHDRWVAGTSRRPSRRLRERRQVDQRKKGPDPQSARGFAP